jgi:molybdopterin molybdotransferase
MFQSQADLPSRYVIQALDLSEALDTILSLADEKVLGHDRASESVTVGSALGRVLAEAVNAPVDLPPFDSSAMDGYAYRASPGGEELTIIGESLAGHPFGGEIGPGECVRITTGAAVPETADTVVIQENCDRENERIHLLSVPEPGANVRALGHDIRKGQTLGSRGTRLNAFDLSWFSACGITSVDVTLPLRVAVFSTGDELVPPGNPLGGGQIYDANRQALLSMLAPLPVLVTDLGILPDDRDGVRSALASAAENADVLMTSGGVSVGDADYVRDVVEELGRIALWRLNLKPGKPLAFGAIGEALFVGLPGNPVSTIVTYLLIARPLLEKLSGAEPAPPRATRARLLETVKHAPGREEYQRGITEVREGELRVRVSGDQSSNRLATFHGADCFIRIPKESGDLEGGLEVDVLLFSGLLD